MKKLLIILAALTLALTSFSGCKKSEAENKEEIAVQQPSEDKTQETQKSEDENNENETLPDVPVNQSNRLVGTYWVATGHIAYGKGDDVIEWTGDNKKENRFADLYFDTDGTALFRDVENSEYIYTKHYNWTDDGETIHLVNQDKEDWGNEFFAKLEDGVIYFEAFECILRMESAERPVYGSEYSEADALGAWKLTVLEKDGKVYKAEEDGIYSTIVFDEAQDENGVPYLGADYYFEMGGEEKTITDAVVSETEVKHLKFASGDGNTRFEVIFKDDNTLTVTEFTYSDIKDHPDSVKMTFKRYGIKEQYSDRMTRLDEKYNAAFAKLTSKSEKDSMSYEHYMAWNEVFNDLGAYLKKHVPSAYDGIRTQQIAWVLNRQKKMDAKEEFFKGTDGELVEKYNEGSRITREECEKYLELIK